MINRMEQYLNHVRSPASSTDYWWVETWESAYFVSASTARAIERRLEREPMLRIISESTAEQRASARALRRALRDERGSEENPWEDGDRQ